MTERRWCGPEWPEWEADSDGKIYRNGIEISGRDHQGRIAVYINGKDAHRSWLVCTAFHGSRPQGMHCLHNDDDKTNDRASNLRWGTNGDNVRDAFRNGLHFRKGEKNGRAILTEDDSLLIKQEYALGGCTQTDLANKYGVGQTQISRVISGKAWQVEA